jgi:signal transduction histidine kinase
MNNRTISKKVKSRNFFPGSLSIQQKLPLLICALLLAVIIIFSWVSYIGVRNAGISMGKERLTSVTQQLSNMFGTGGPAIIANTRTAAAKEQIQRSLIDSGNVIDTATINILEKLTPDSTWASAELLDNKFNSIARVGYLNPSASLKLDVIIPSLSLKADEARTGNLYTTNDSLFYPVVATVTHNHEQIGYLVRWRFQHASEKVRGELSKLLGEDAVLFVGNRDGSLWTDLREPVKIAVDANDSSETFLNFSVNGQKIMATVQGIPHTPWFTMVGFSKKSMLESSNRFLRSTVLIGGLLILLGMLVARYMSRRITSPLKKLTAAATAIAAGDHSVKVPVRRRDELGELAKAFHKMNVHIHSAKYELEEKVRERTAQLEAANKELEAFSYSVSHDLRAPLRAISGYTAILKEEYGRKLDDEANRITDRIVSNAGMMGQLIDNLISFSKMGMTEAIHGPVDMKKLAEQCMMELLSHDKQKKYQVYISSLPACYGDKALLKQVWLNLISNAIKYSSKVPVPCIEIGCIEGTTMHTYFIKDNGAGFDMKHYSKLFGVFQRLHSQKNFEGTGIGLAFVKRILQKHGGEITAESSPDQGATFYFSLPASKLSIVNGEGLSSLNADAALENSSHD